MIYENKLRAGFFALSVTIILFMACLIPFLENDENAERSSILSKSIEEQMKSSSTRGYNEVRGDVDTDNDGIPDDEDILDDGNAACVISIDYIGLDGDADFWSEGDPYFIIWIDLNHNYEIDEEDGETWTSPMFEDTDEISDEGFDDEGILWHGMDIDDDFTDLYMQIAALDDDNDGDYEIIDICSEEDRSELSLFFTPENDGLQSHEFSDDGSDDEDGSIDAYIEISFHIIRGTSIEETTPESYEITHSEGGSIHFEIDRISLPSSTVPIDQVLYVWLFSYKNGDDEEWYTLSNETDILFNDYDLHAHFGSEGEYYIAGIVFTMIEGHDCYFWDYRVWDLTIIHNNTTPNAEISVDSTSIEQFESLTFSGWRSTDLDGDELTYYWDFGDGTSGEGVDISHSFDNPGNYDITLVVEDDEGESDEVIKQIVVNPLDLSMAEYWTDLEDGMVFTLNTDYESIATSRTSKSITIPLILGYSLDVSMSFVSNTIVEHYGNATFLCSIEENKDVIDISTNLIETDDWYTVYYYPFIEIDVSINNEEGNSETMWDTIVPVPIESNANDLDEDGEPLVSIPVFGLGEIDIFTWDKPMIIYQSDTLLFNATGNLEPETLPITVVDVDILSFLESITGFFPALSFGIEILDYFVNLFLQGNLNFDLILQEEIGLLTRTTGTLEGDSEFFWYDFSNDEHTQSIEGTSSLTKTYGIMRIHTESKIHASLDIYFNLSTAGQTVYGLWITMNEKGFIAGIWDAFTDFLTGGELPKEDYSFRKTLWGSGDLISMENDDLYYWDYLSYTHDFINNKPTISLRINDNYLVNETLNIKLIWEGMDQDNDTLRYSLYIGINSNENMILIAEDLTETIYVPDLDYNTEYFWKIIVTDGFDTVSSETRSFKTAQESKPGGNSGDPSNDEQPDESNGEVEEFSDDSPGFPAISLIIVFIVGGFLKGRKKNQ